MLHSTNNFPEFTGRICPAPCEAACVLGINEPPVTIKNIEKTIVDRAWEEGWIVPEPPPLQHRQARRGRRLRARRASPPRSNWRAPATAVTVFEKADRIGGLLRYGIPNFKMEKHLIDRRIDQMRAEGVEFEVERARRRERFRLTDLRRDFDAILLAAGAEQPRDLKVPGRELKGIHFAMEFLPQSNKVCEGDTVPDQILATGKRVVIIGGGDTGADCLGTSHRHKARAHLAVRTAAQAARRPRAADALAALADAAARRKLARRRRRCATGASRPFASPATPTAM